MQPLRLTEQPAEWSPVGPNPRLPAGPHSRSPLWIPRRQQAPRVGAGPKPSSGGRVHIQLAPRPLLSSGPAAEKRAAGALAPLVRSLNGAPRPTTCHSVPAHPELSHHDPCPAQIGPAGSGRQGPGPWGPWACTHCGPAGTGQPWAAAKDRPCLALEPSSVVLRRPGCP